MTIEVDFARVLLPVVVRSEEGVKVDEKTAKRMAAQSEAREERRKMKRRVGEMI